ncbi:MAG: hypothetical protein COA65_06880 [Rhodospirillaceae bacterium]|nr:MAG: hypothetical protein COA65_06880 [Rhodospirillaceae bacterium]
MATKNNIAWITGASGFLGSHAVRLLGARDWQVVGVSRSPQPSSSTATPACKGWSDAGINERSLLALLDQFGPPALVFHTAGAGSVGQAAENPLQSFNDMVTTTAILCEILRLHAPDATLLLASSAAVYGVREPVALKESDAAKPVSSYGWHKHMAEELCCQASALHGLRTIVIRYFSLYGPGLQKQIIWDISRRMNAGEKSIELFGDGGETRDFLFIDDAVNLALEAYEKAPKLHSVFNGGSGTPATIADLSQALAHTWDSNAVITFNGKIREGDPRHFLACPAKAQTLGFRPKTDLNDGLAQVVAWSQHFSKME